MKTSDKMFLEQDVLGTTLERACYLDTLIMIKTGF